jgi:hypothetical protein
LMGYTTSSVRALHKEWVAAGMTHACLGVVHSA